MKLLGLTRFIRQLDPFAALRSRQGHSRVFGLLRAAYPAVLAVLANDSDAPLLVVTAHPQAAHDLAEDLRLWADRPVRHFPAIESLPYERVRLDRAVLAERETVAQAVFGGEPTIVVAPVRALLQPIQRPTNSEALRPLRVGERVPPDQVISAWIEGGYAESSMVDEPGTFARRGGVVDVFPAGATEPARLEWFGNDIESMRSFDPGTQRSTGSVSMLSVPPIAAMGDDIRLEAVLELLDLDTSSLNAEARTWWDTDLGSLEAGGSADELAFFGPYLLRQPLSLAEMLPSGSSICVLDAEETFGLASDLAQQAEDRQQELEDAGDLPRGLRPALQSSIHLRASLAQRRLFEFLPGTSIEEGDVDLRELFLPANLYAGRLRALVRDLASAPSRRSVITSLQQERLLEILRDTAAAVRLSAGLEESPETGTTLLPFSVAEGWLLPGLSVALLGDHEIFGRARSRSVLRRRRAARETFFSDYSPGDFVVHLEHGIGRFDGVTRVAVDGTEREYALVQYAGTDRVYVPSDQLERLTRYVGMGDATPALNKLGGGEWNRARQRAARAAEDIARELVDVYSKRMARPGYAFDQDTPWQHELEASFPYHETPDQMRAIEEVKTDMEESRPMDRLVCADVGYGKTEVAVRAAFKALMDGRQAAVLVPTTILAQQHYETFGERMGAFPARVEVLSRFRSPAEQRSVLDKLANGEVDVLIGTHRLLSKDVKFKDLGLLIIDEEQRFGVKHKEQLKKLRETIDVLTLTATPIPRTLHMGLVGIREISIIDTAPEGRLPIKTFLQPFDERLLREALLREMDRDGQVYVVHNKVATIEALAERVRVLVPEARILVGHGQMEEAQLQQRMLDFARHDADVLICSTIIENGLDIPNVNTIIVNNAHRLGLTQLYQLRGRVGRSANQAYAYLLYPRDIRLNHDAGRRLEAVFEAQELGAGFNIAMRDLEIRGAGNLLGAEQSGHASAIGFDLYTRMVSDAVERLRGVPVEETKVVTIDLPLSRFLPTDYIRNETERLAMYRRLAAVSDQNELESLVDELRDRFGHPPPPVENLVLSVHLKLRSLAARVSSLSLNGEQLILRAQSDGIYDRVALYRRYGITAKIATNVLRIPRESLGGDWIQPLKEILADMISLRESSRQLQAVEA
jgi:transcription-repair coupling factor (superfamily II helicase)